MKWKAQQELVSCPYNGAAVMDFLICRHVGPSLCSPSPTITFSHSPTEFPFQRSLLSDQHAEPTSVSLLHVISAVREGVSKSSTRAYRGSSERSIMHFQGMPLPPFDSLTEAAPQTRLRPGPRPGAIAPSSSKDHLPDQNGRPAMVTAQNSLGARWDTWRSCYPAAHTRQPCKLEVGGSRNTLCSHSLS